MSALARYARLKGCTVFGYDSVRTALTDLLSSEGIAITYTDAVAEIPLKKIPKENALIIYTPAIPEHNAIFNFFKTENYNLIKRARFLGQVTKNTTCLAVAGTHGKTTTSAILAHLLAACNMPVTAFLGGIAENHNSNFIYRGDAITVVEADEFDRSFLSLSPNIACITTMDADHLDIYGDATGIERAFQKFAALVPGPQNLLHKKGLPLNGKTVAIESPADFEAQNVTIKDGAYYFNLKTPTATLKNLRLTLPGRHNLHNAVTALGMALMAGAPSDGLPAALAGFKGVQRRFTYKIKTEKCVLIDDYAHHPTELDALLRAVNEMYPNDKKVIVFQPHLYSRTRDFATGFAKSLARFDEVLLLNIYPAREEPIKGIDAHFLLKKTNNTNVEVITKGQIAERLNASPARIKLLVGAGDIGAEVEKISKKLKR